MTRDDRVLSFVMAGGRGSRLKVLTRDRCKPALDILSHYRILDFAATNIANTGIPVMLIAAQFQPESLGAYIGTGEIWGFDGIDRKLEMVYPNEGGRSLVTFKGTADCVRKSIARIDRYDPSIVLVVGADHIYTMDYTDVIAQHKMNDADITIMTNVVPDSKVSDFGVVKIDSSGRVIDFAEKPIDKEVIESFRLTDTAKSRLGIDSPNLNFLASMGNYVFFWDRLKKFLDFPGVDFGKDIIPAIKENCKALYAYIFDGYWRDIGKIRDYFDCNMDFACKEPPINLSEHRIEKDEGDLPCAWIASSASIHGAVLSSGDILHQGSVIANSVLGCQVVIEEECRLDHCILLGAEGNGVRNDLVKREYTTHIGRGSSLSYVILDKNVCVGEGVEISPRSGTPERRKEILQSAGLKPYRELDDGTVEGDFFIEPEMGILVIGKQYDVDPRKPILPSGLKC